MAALKKRLIWVNNDFGLVRRSMRAHSRERPAFRAPAATGRMVPEFPLARLAKCRRVPS
jgi:hypothetical protein